MLPGVKTHEGISLATGDHVSADPESQGPHQDVQDVLDQNICRVLCSDTPSLEKCKAALEEEYDETVDQDEERVDGFCHLFDTCPGRFCGGCRQIHFEFLQKQLSRHFSVCLFGEILKNIHDEWIYLRHCLRLFED